MPPPELRGLLDELGERAAEIASPHLSPGYRAVVCRAVIDSAQAAAGLARLLLHDLEDDPTGGDQR